MKLSFKLLLLLLLFFTIQAKASTDDNLDGKFTISGYVKDASNGELLIGSTILIKEESKGTATNIYGFYSLSLKPGTYTLIFSFIGYNSQERVIKLAENTTINIELNLESQVLQEVVVSREKPNSNITKPQMSVTRLEMKSIQRIPALMGEVDVLKAIQMLPGVQSTAEGSSGYSVRGGSADQNLIQLDEATVYNASHIMGFFSVFNNDAIKDVKLYKGDIPASSGGRLSSLLDVRMKDGNSKQFEGTGGIGTISSRFTFEGPILKDNTSFIVSGRRTYIDLFFPFFKNQELKDSRLYFYDLTMKVNHTINENNRIYLSGYFGRDVYKIVSSEFGYGNKTMTMRWNHLFGKKLFLNTTAIYSNYNYLLGSDFEKASSFRWISDVSDYSLKLNFNYYMNPSNSIQFGAQTTYHRFNPGLVKGKGSESMINEIRLPINNSLEHGIYALNEQAIGSRLTLKYGVRLSVFQNIGKAKLFHYDQNYISTGSTDYSSGDIFNTYTNLEPRLGLTYALNRGNSVKMSYSRTFQYIQQASNSQGGTPLDVWFPASPNVKPQRSDLVALGFFKNLMDNTIETSAEVYYKTMSDVVDFKEFANLFLNEQLEGELRVGKGRSYGMELMAKINRKKFGGWVSYTYSRSYRTIPTIEKGKEYRAPYDKPHNVTVVLSYDITRRVTLSANWLFSTGQPFTVPSEKIVVDGSIIPIISQRNGERYPNYHRLDVAITIKTKKSFTRRWKGEWNISFYNIYNRKNAWAINFMQDKENANNTYVEKTYLFPIIPSVSYNFKF
ncbi:MAG: TonB-dependent receptor [Bacteroidales bacterium]|nr:MAG: TonB-dependent receptor [Bacteroidales bacterium]